LNADTLLQTHAEVAIALAGFASVVAALGRPLSAFARQRFLSLLALSLLQVLGCLLPLWCLGLFDDRSVVWRLLSLLLVVLNAGRLWWLVIVPNRRLAEEDRTILAPLTGRIIWGIGWLSLGLFMVNAVGFPLPPSFNVYYGGLLCGLVIGFALFADVAIGSPMADQQTGPFRS
jgi:hypothetical protein